MSDYEYMIGDQVTRLPKRRATLKPGTRVTGAPGHAGRIVRALYDSNGWHYRVKWDNGTTSVAREGFGFTVDKS